jgi:hypothetical protein
MRPRHAHTQPSPLAVVNPDWRANESLFSLGANADDTKSNFMKTIGLSGHRNQSQRHPARAGREIPPVAGNARAGIGAIFRRWIMPALALLLAGSGVRAQTSGDFNYSDQGASITITGYTGSAAAISIPANIQGKPVTAIGDNAFNSSSSLSRVTLPDSVISIGDAAFAYCGNLTGISMGKGLRSIGIQSFWGCSRLSDISLPASLTSIGADAFDHCNSLTVISIPHNVVTLGNYAFYNCTGLTSISILGGITSIEEATFAGCSSLTSISLPPSLASIGDYAFGYCSSLIHVSIPVGVTFIGEGAFAFCGDLQSINLPDNITAIPDALFLGCGKLASISIPEGVTSIGISAFSLCSSLTHVSIPASVTFIGEGTFAFCDALKSVNLPHGITAILEGTFYQCGSLTGISIPDGVTSIGIASFARCNSLTSIAIPAGVTSIDPGAFDRCANLTRIDANPASATYASVDGVLFDASRTQLLIYPSGRSDPSYVIPTGVTSIAPWAFDGCATLTDVVIPASVMAIGDAAFAACSDLVSAYFQGDAPALFGEDVFAGAAPNFAIRRNGAATGFANPWNDYPVFDLDAPASILINLSTRSFVGTGANIQIAGFVISGAQSKQVLIRASGPTLSLDQNVPGALPDPKLTLFRGSTALESNTIWGAAANAHDIETTAHRVGAFPWAEDSHDSALLVTLTPGPYTALVSSQSGDTGVALIEVYDADAGTSSKLINLSARSFVGTGANSQIAGFVITGTQPKQVLIRASGPALSLDPDLPGALPDPVLTLFRGSAAIRTNTGWSTAVNAAAIRTTAHRVGAFPWAEGSRDSALLVTLTPGPYTALVSGQSGDTGVTLIEVYDADAD